MKEHEQIERLLLLESAVERLERKINQTERQIMSAVKDLAALLTTMDGQIATIKTSFDAFVASLANTPLPADAQAALDKLTTDVGALSSDVTAATAPPTTGTTGA